MIQDDSVLITDDPDLPQAVHTPFTQCVHCGRHVQYQPGSGRLRGWCWRCNGMFCGPDCEKCVAKEQQLENMAQGKDATADHPIAVPVIWVPGK